MKNTRTLTVKGQVTVPKDLRDALSWKPGDEVEFIREPDGVKIIRARRRRRGARVVDSLKTDPGLEA